MSVLNQSTKNPQLRWNNLEELNVKQQYNWQRRMKSDNLKKRSKIEKITSVFRRNFKKKR